MFRPFLPVPLIKIKNHITLGPPGEVQSNLQSDRIKGSHLMLINRLQFSFMLSYVWPYSLSANAPEFRRHIKPKSCHLTFCHIWLIINMAYLVAQTWSICYLGFIETGNLKLTITADSGIGKLKMATTPDSKPQDVVSVHSWGWRVLCFLLSSHTLFLILTHQILPLLKQDDEKPVDNYPKAICRRNGTTRCSWVATARLLPLGRHCRLT